MKKSTVFFALTVSAALVMMTSGCKKSQVGNTHIPGMRPQAIEIPNSQNPGSTEVNSGTLPTTPEVPTVTADPNQGVGFNSDAKWDPIWNGPLNANRDILAKDIIHFDTDASSIKPSEQPKLDEIIKYFKDNKTDVLMIEGYCDERGTEGYNMSLGDKRALAIREYLATGGVEPGRIHTVSFGESKPVNPAHNEAAWKQNRRGEPVVMQPKQN